MPNLDDRFTRDEDDDLDLDDINDEIDDLDLLEDDNDEHELFDERDDTSRKEELETAEPILSAHDVEVTVKCEVGQINLSLAELLELKLGSVVEIAKWPNCVKLSANGTYFAEGQLVEVNNFIGVKITKRINSNL